MLIIEPLCCNGFVHTIKIQVFSFNKCPLISTNITYSLQIEENDV